MISTATFRERFPVVRGPLNPITYTLINPVCRPNIGVHLRGGHDLSPLGLPVFRSISSSMHAGATTPAEPLGAIAIPPNGGGLPQKPATGFLGHQLRLSSDRRLPQWGSPLDLHLPLAYGIMAGMTGESTAAGHAS